MDATDSVHSREELSSSSDTEVHLDLLADTPTDLAVPQAELARLRALIVQTSRVSGTPPFKHYDVLVSLSDELSPGGGLEHLDEGENNLPGDYFKDTVNQLNNRDLIAHEYVHAWNGRFRQPAGLWSPTFNQPTDPSLLWVYEGQTEFWGRILAARSGLRTVQETLDKLALDASLVADRNGRQWNTLADSTLDVLYMPHHSVPWRNWQRREDYYPEGVLLWMDVDARLRELSGNKYGLDDFAQRFFATHGKLESTSTYDFDDICRALNVLAPADWKTLLNQHLLTHNTTVAPAGLGRAGWQLTYDATPTETFLQAQKEDGVINLDTSLGAQFRADGTVHSVVWNSPAFEAGLTAGKRVSAVNDVPFSRSAVLKATANSASTPIRLTVENDGMQEETLIRYIGPQNSSSFTRVPSSGKRPWSKLLALVSLRTCSQQKN